MTDYKVAFCGLPSSGKSTIINSLLHKRLLGSGIARTTVDVKIFDKPIKDDDGNKICVIDLPGICDAEEKDDKYNKLTLEIIENANLICWVSDIKSAFITTYEVFEFTRILEHIEALKEKNIKLYEVAIILSKCSQSLNIENININNNDVNDNEDCISIDSVDENYIDEEEIENNDEDTTITDVINNVKTKFKDITVIPFNAFGRCYHHPKTTKQLKDFILRHGGIPSNANIEFKISQFVKNYKQNNECFIFNLFTKGFSNYMILNHNDAKLDSTFDNITKIFYNLNENNKTSVIKNLSENKINDKEDWKIFRINNFFLDKVNFAKEFLLKECDINKLTEVVLYYLIKIIYEGAFTYKFNLVNDFTFETIDTKINDIILKNNEQYNKYIIKIVFDYLNQIVYASDKTSRLICILEKFTLYDIENYSYIINILYNSFIMDEKNYVKIILSMCKKEFNNICKIPKLTNNLEDIETILSIIKMYCDNKYMILMNKIYCYYEIKNKLDDFWKIDIIPGLPFLLSRNATISYETMPTNILHYFCNNNKLIQRIKIMPEYKEIISIGMCNIFEKVLTEYDNIVNVKPLYIEEIINIKEIIYD